jgi:DNA-binding winged helix-turn-helix (wHTH) protein
MRTVFTIKEQNHPQPDTLYLDIRPGRRELRYKKAFLKLPLRQYKFMQALMANHPKPMTHWDLFYHIWGEGSEGRMNFTDENGGPLTPSSCITQYATKLRAKLQPLGLTINAPRKGYGYEINQIKAPLAQEAPADPARGKAEPLRRPARGEEVELSPGITLTIEP